MQNDDSFLGNYLVSQGPTLAAVADPTSLTPEERQAQQEALKAYYRIGDEVTMTLPNTPVYVTPQPATRTFTLPANLDENNHNITYLTQAEIDEQNATSSVGDTTSSDATSGGATSSGLASTGVNFTIFAAVGGLLAAGGVFALVRRSK